MNIIELLKSNLFILKAISKKLHNKSYTIYLNKINEEINRLQVKTPTTGIRNNPILEVYEYELGGYPKNPYKPKLPIYMKDIREVKGSKCGYGKIKGYNKTDKRPRSCDLLNFNMII